MKKIIVAVTILTALFLSTHTVSINITIEPRQSTAEAAPAKKKAQPQKKLTAQEQLAITYVDLQTQIYAVEKELKELRSDMMYFCNPSTQVSFYDLQRLTERVDDIERALSYKGIYVR